MRSRGQTCAVQKKRNGGERERWTIWREVPQVEPGVGNLVRHDGLLWASLFCDGGFGVAAAAAAAVMVGVAAVVASKPKSLSGCGEETKRGGCLAGVGATGSQAGKEEERATRASPDGICPGCARQQRRGRERFLLRRVGVGGLQIQRRRRGGGEEEEVVCEVLGSLGLGWLAGWPARLGRRVWGQRDAGRAASAQGRAGQREEARREAGGKRQEAKKRQISR